MNDKLLITLFNMLILLGIVVILFGVWFVIWSAIRYPIRLKDDILKEREEQQKELLKIQAAKGVEWDEYKNLKDEIDKLRKAYFQTKLDFDKLKEDHAKELIQKEKLITLNKELKKQKNTSKTSAKT